MKKCDSNPILGLRTPSIGYYRDITRRYNLYRYGSIVYLGRHPKFCHV